MGKVSENFSMDYTFYITELMFVFSYVIVGFLLYRRMSLFNIKCLLCTRSIVDTIANQDADKENRKHGDPQDETPLSHFRLLFQESSE